MQVGKMIYGLSVSVDRESTARPERLYALAAVSLSLAAAPTFAIMALLTGIHSDGMANVLCSERHGAWSLSGMLAMYILMSAFHLTPWLRVLCGRRMQDKLDPRRRRRCV